MASLWQGVRRTFWNEWFWLPSGYTWDDLKNKDDGIYKPQTSDLLAPLFVAVTISLLRRVFERVVAIPFGQALGLKEKQVVYPDANRVLEAAFRKNKKPSNSVFEGLAKQADMSVRQVERWYRKRRNQEKTQLLHKFAECCWRCFFYFIIFWYGLYVLWDKPWLWDSQQCWLGWPEHHISDDLYWYYSLEAGFYISLLFSQFTDVRRKDFHEMFIHHLVTLGLIFMSWMENLVRIGTLILAVHDAVDYWLEAAKMAKYVGKQRLCDALFVVFAVIWVITRMIIFPLKIIRSTLFHATPIVGFCNVYYIYNILLVTLQVLHVFWFIIICKAVAVFLGKDGGRDIRSSSEESVTEDEGGQHRVSPSTDIPKTNGGRAKNGSRLRLRDVGAPDVAVAANGNVFREGQSPTNGYSLASHSGTEV